MDGWMTGGKEGERVVREKVAGKGGKQGEGGEGVVGGVEGETEENGGGVCFRDQSFDICKFN